MNILLDALPTEYKGYKINTDFRTGIKLSNIFSSYYESEEDQLDDAIDALWGSGVPTAVSEDKGIDIDYPLIFETINWFMNCGNLDTKPKKKDKDKKEVEDIPYDFDIDANFIFSAFYQQYGIDLTETNMHWFKFVALFSSLQDTVFSRIQEIRTQDLSEISDKKQRSLAYKQKESFKIKKVTPEQQRRLEAVFGDEWEEHI
jgi:hypothetical protein